MGTQAHTYQKRVPIKPWLGPLIERTRTLTHPLTLHCTLQHAENLACKRKQTIKNSDIAVFNFV